MGRRDEMPQDATVETDEGLSPVQERALDALLGGKTVTEAAREVEVDRSTVHRWRNHPIFLAALNRRRAESREAADVTLDRIRAKALEGVERALDGDDPRTALAVLRGLGMLPGSRRLIGSDDPVRIAEEQALAATGRDSLAALLRTPR